MRAFGFLSSMIAAISCFVALAASDAEARKPKKLELGVGLLGFVNGSFLTEPDEKDKIATIQAGNQSVQSKIPYPGFGGVGGGGGITTNVMYRGAIGGQLDFLFSNDVGTGQINDIDVDIGQGAFHIPLMLRAAIPARTVRPFLLVGPEFVIPGTPKIESDVFIKTPKAKADPYVALGFGLGFEFLLPGGHDLRIPLMLRGNVNFDVPEGTDGRVKLGGYDPATGEIALTEVSTAWQYQAFVMLGFTWNQAID
jgi:hypothetical protein